MFTGIIEGLGTISAIRPVGGGGRRFVLRADFDLDGREETALVRLPYQAFLKPDLGGRLFEFSHLDAAWNPLLCLSRRIEAYHEEIFHPKLSHLEEGISTIHNLHPQADETIKRELFYDWYTKNSLVDHISDESLDLQSFRACSFKEYGDFASREALKNVKGLGAKAFQQAAGFLRIKNGNNPLDGSAVHPERYKVVEKIANKLKLELPQLIGNKTIKDKINLQDFVTDEMGLPTLNDILQELEKPGRDPRRKFKQFEFDKNIRTINDLQEGMTLNGIVINLTNFGAFIDLGIKENGLIHKSQIADEYVSDPGDFLKLNQHVRVKILEIDITRKRIALTMKQQGE